MHTFPTDAFLLILYANFLLEVRKDAPAARTQLQLALKHMPTLVQRYQVRSLAHEPALHTTHGPCSCSMSSSWLAIKHVGMLRSAVCHPQQGAFMCVARHTCALAR